MNDNLNDQPSSDSARSNGFGRNILILLLWLLFFNLFVFRGADSLVVPYSQFLDQIDTGQVSEVKIGTTLIEYSLKPQVPKDAPQSEQAEKPKTLRTIPIANDSNLSQLLRQKKIQFSAFPENTGGWFGTLLGWVVPPLIFIAVWIWFLGRSQANNMAPFNVGKSKARIYAKGSTGVSFEDVAGVDEAKAELEEIVEFLKNAVKYVNLGAKIPKDVLLIGPPGTGKTLLAKAIAGEAGVPFFSISGSEFIELFVGIGASRVRDLFEQAKLQSPCIVFIDELDALGRSRVGANPMMGGNDEREQTLNQLLAEMDGFEPNTGVILLAATNRPEVLDPALLRPGRFDRQVLVDRPDKSGREAILRVHAKDVKLANNVDLDKLAARTPGFAGADLANLINEAALLAARKNHLLVSMEDLNEAIERLLTGLEKKSRVLSDIEKKTVAYHEVGHAILAALMPGAGVVEKISIVPRGLGALGYTLQLPEEDRFLMLEDEIRGRIVTLLGGRSAEELMFGKVSTGASDDIQKATELAERFVTLYGMSDVLGPIAFEKNQSQFLDAIANPRRSVSPRVAEEIDQEIQGLIEGAHQIALLILNKNKNLLDAIARVLLDKESLEGDWLKEQLKQAEKTEHLQDWLSTGNLSHRINFQSIANGQVKNRS